MNLFWRDGRFRWWLVWVVTYFAVSWCVLDWVWRTVAAPFSSIAFVFVACGLLGLVTLIIVLRRFGRS